MKHTGDPKIGVILAASLGAAVVVGPRVDASGQPVQRFRKELIRVGEWVHPDTGQDIEVTTDRIDHWVTQFSAMKADGVKVYLPSGHTSDPAKNRGWVVEMFREGETLVGLFDAIGEDAIREASRNDVSVRVCTLDITTATGLKTYDDAIEHVALTPIPVITGQKHTVAITASRGTVNVPAFRLSTGGSMESLKKICAALGIEWAEGMTEESATAAIMSNIEAAKASKADAETKAKDATTALSLARAELAKATPEKHSAAMLDLARENRTVKIDALVNAGKITPAVATDLKSIWCPTDDAALSLSMGMNTTFKATLAALDKNDAKALGEQTKGQQLSRTTPGSEFAFDLADAQARAARAFGVKAA